MLVSYVHLKKHKLGRIAYKHKEVISDVSPDSMQLHFVMSEMVLGLCYVTSPCITENTDKATCMAGRKEFDFQSESLLSCIEISIQHL